MTTVSMWTYVQQTLHVLIFLGTWTIILHSFTFELGIDNMYGEVMWTMATKYMMFTQVMKLKMLS